MPKKEQPEGVEAAPAAPQQAIETILVINVLLALLEQLIPKINGWINQGNITVEEGEAIRARYDKIMTVFGGDHWKVRPDPSGNVPQIPTKMMPAKSAKPTDDAKDCSD